MRICSDRSSRNHPHWVLFVLGSLLLGLAFPTRGNGQRSESPAQWIGVSDVPEKAAGVFSFRKILLLKDVEPSYVVNVSGDSRFVLYVNGKRVGTGPARGDLAHWRYETFDLATSLHAGTNVIAARVWNFGYQASTARVSLKRGFILWASAAGQSSIDTDKSWETRTESAWTHVSPGQPVSSNVGPKEILDGRLYDWREAKDAATWAPARVVATAKFERGSHEPTSKSWNLSADKLPPMEYTEEAAGSVVRSSGSA